MAGEQRRLEEALNELKTQVLLAVARRRGVPAAASNIRLRVRHQSVRKVFEELERESQPLSQRIVQALRSIFGIEDA